MANSQSIGFGNGVAGLYNRILIVQDPDATLISGDGSTWNYTSLNGTTHYYTTPAGTLNSLEETSSMTWVETQPDGLQFNYSLLTGNTTVNFAQLASMTNRGGQTWTMSYDPTMRHSARSPIPSAY